MRDLILCALECGPFVILLLVWFKLYRSAHRLSHLTLAALIISTANAGLSAWWFLYFTVIKPPTSFLPPWQDPIILDFSLFFFLAPIPAIVELCAMKREESKPPAWVWLTIYSTSFVLFILGMMSGVAV